MKANLKWVGFQLRKQLVGANTMIYSISGSSGGLKFWCKASVFGEGVQLVTFSDW